MNDDEIVRRAMSILGKRTSPRKTAAVRRNAKRPRKRHAKPKENYISREKINSPNTK